MNKPIENYEEMLVIFGNGMATGKYAIGSNEALGSPSDFAESCMKGDSTDDGKGTKSAEDLGKLFADAARGSDVLAGTKRKRSMLSDDDTHVLSSMTDAVNNVADAIRATKVDEVHPELYGAVMYMAGFP